MSFDSDHKFCILQELHKEGTRSGAFGFRSIYDTVNRTLNILIKD